MHPPFTYLGWLIIYCSLVATIENVRVLYNQIGRIPASYLARLLASKLELCQVRMGKVGSGTLATCCVAVSRLRSFSLIYFIVVEG